MKIKRFLDIFNMHHLIPAFIYFPFSQQFLLDYNNDGTTRKDHSNWYISHLYIAWK